MDIADRPPWSVTEPDWPTRAEQVGRARLGVPVTWGPAITSPALGGVTESTFAGSLPGEFLAVAVMPQADPTNDLGLWVDATITLIGLPHPGSAPADLLEWSAEGEQSGWAADLAVDSCLTYQGVLGDSPNLNRCYAMLARRGTTAWRIVLSISSVLLPRTSYARVRRYDHVRAAAVFAGLTLG